jgi:hypothetical protein
MTKQEIAMEYLRCFCAGDIDGIDALLADNLHFTGTLHTYHSAREYLDSLRKDPPEACDYKVLSITESDQHVALFYEYQKPDRTMQIAQLFRIEDEKIHKVLLIFDSRGFD